MSDKTCPGSGKKAQGGTTSQKKICPVCHATSSAGLKGKTGKNVIVPNHPARSR